MTAPASTATTLVPIDSLEAFESVRREIEAVTPAETASVNVDILLAVTTVLGALPKLRQLRWQLVELRGFDVVRFDRLEAYARALGHTHTLLLRSRPSSEIAALAAEAADLREILLTDATALARRSLLERDALNHLKGAVGYRNLAFDLGALSNLLRQNWAVVRGRSAVQENELELARALTDQLLTAVGRRRFAAPMQSEAALTRKRAFTVFVGAYDHVRRAVSYLRWEEGDVNEFAPSLYQRRNKKKAQEGPGLPEDTPLES